jgi:predicted ATPase with chaperone activity
MPEATDPLVALKFEGGEIKKEGIVKDKTTQMRDQVLNARDFSLFRNRKFGIKLNNEIGSSQILDSLGICHDQVEEYIKKFVPKLNSTRTLVKILRVARTLADIELRETVNEEDIKQAASWSYEPGIQGYSDLEEDRLALLRERGRISKSYRDTTTPPLS